MLSVLICSLENRKHFLQDIIAQLKEQVGETSYIKTGQVERYLSGDVEIIVYTDNKKISVGDKRNRLIQLAKGDYFCFIDDDDKISPEYISAIKRGLRKNPDVITFYGFRYENGKPDRRVNYDLEFDKDRNLSSHYERRPNHLCVWKKSLAVEFKDISYGEDADWAERMKAETQYKINKILYFYYFNQKTTETQK